MRDRILCLLSIVLLAIPAEGQDHQRRLERIGRYADEGRAELVERELAVVLGGRVGYREMGIAGDAMSRLGRFEEADSWFERALTARGKRLGPGRYREHLVRTERWEVLLRWMDDEDARAAEWRMHSGCGFGADIQRGYDALLRGRALRALGRDDELVALLEPLALNSWRLPFAEDFLPLFADVLRERGALVDFLARSEGPQVSWLRGAEEIRSAKAAGDLDTLFAFALPRTVDESRTDEHPDLRGRALRTLVELGDAVLPHAFAHIGDDPWGLWLLAGLGAEEVIPLVRVRVRDARKTRGAEEVLHALAVLGTASAHEALRELSHDRRTKVAVAARRTLRRLSSEREVPLVPRW